ncbi:MAG: hypothetical protein ACM3WP_04180 [Acidobacteriota bacterium]
MEGGLCFFHANPDKAVELGRIGGTKNHYAFVDEDRPLLAIESVKEVQTTLSRLIDEVYSSKLSPKTAAGLAALLNLQWRVIRSTDLEKRILRLEQAQAQSQDGGGFPPATIQPPSQIAADRHDGLEDEEVPETYGLDGSS